VDPYRLPRTVFPTRYELRLEPDLASSTFQGKETISLTVQEPTATIVLNAAELIIDQASIRHQDGRTVSCTITLHEPLERCELTCPTSLDPGSYSLSLEFKGTLNDKLRGFYRSTFTDKSGNTQTLAATQFEATDARRAFPCWDEPAYKAVFATTLVIDSALTAISNSAVKSERTKNGKKTIEFHDTITMSTYLVAFIVGSLKATEPTLVGDTPVRIWAVPAKRHLASFGQAIATFSLQFFSEYYGRPYPGDKLDLIAIPDFASGAMENLGAITYRETALLIDEHEATHAEIERVADVVAHENAHMWFGDLVTMTWWNGLWLNEAFATFMEMKAVDAWKPEWDRWTTFGVSRAAALAVDGLWSTRPIEYPVQAPKDADAMFDVLTYEKGASVLRMLEQYLGPDVFRDGIRRYLNTHAYANADTGDLWTALEGAANQPVPSLMDAWVFQKGYPLITVERQGESRVTLTQQRFAYLPPPPEETLPLWQVPLQVGFFTSKARATQHLLLTTPSVTLELPEGCTGILINEEGAGCYRVRYSPKLLDELLHHLTTRISPIERFNLVNDAWASTLAGLMPLEDYLNLTSRFKGERDKNVWAVIIDSFHYLNRIIEPVYRPALETLVRERIGPEIETLGWTPRPGEKEVFRQLRGDLIRALGTIGNDQGTQSRAVELFTQHDQDPRSVDPNLISALVSILACTGDLNRYHDFSQRMGKAVTPQEERRFLFALASFRDPKMLEKTLASTQTDAIRTQDGPFVVGAVLMNVHGREIAWDFLKRNWETLDNMFPKQGLRRMCGGIVSLATPIWEQDVRQFFDTKKIDLGGKTLDQYLEQLRIAVAFRERETSQLIKYLKRFEENPT